MPLARMPRIVLAPPRGSLEPAVARSWCLCAVWVTGYSGLGQSTESLSIFGCTGILLGPQDSSESDGDEWDIDVGYEGALRLTLDILECNWGCPPPLTSMQASWLVD